MCASETIHRSIATLYQAGTLAGQDDGQLLARFLDREGADAEEAFRVLVDRHGPLVLGVCRGILGAGDGVDDAFQATFLVLIRNADSIRRRESLGPWLRGVAARIARRARCRSARNRGREKPLADGASVADPRRPGGDHEGSRLIQDELDRLPERYRLPLILCCLEDFSYDRAARELGLSEPTLRGRLHRGRRTLERRLRAKGIGLREGLFAWGSRGHSSHRFPALREATISLASRSTVPNVVSVLSPSILSLAEGAMPTMFWSSIKAAAAASVLTAGMATAIVFAQQDRKREAQPGTQAVATKAPGTPSRPIDPDAQTRKIQELLDQKITLELPENATLEDLLKAIKQATARDGYHGIPIHVNPQGLTEANQTMRSSITDRYAGWQIGYMLAESLRPIGLAYFVRDGFLMIDSRTAVLERRSELLEQKLDRILKVLSTRYESRQN